MITLWTFTVIAILGCSFLIRFVVALWRELHTPKSQMAKIRPVRGKTTSAKLLVMKRADFARAPEKTGSRPGA